MAGGLDAPSKIVLRDNPGRTMKIPPELLIHSAVATEIESIEGEPGVYVVHLLFDGSPEVFHIELEGPKTSFKVRERTFGQYCFRSPTLKGLFALMRQWHRGERRELPVDLADVDFV